MRRDLGRSSWSRRLVLDMLVAIVLEISKIFQIFKEQSIDAEGPQIIET